MKALITIVLLPFKLLAFILGTGWRVITSLCGLVFRILRFVFTRSLGAMIGVAVGFIVGRKLIEKERDTTPPSA